MHLDDHHQQLPLGLTITSPLSAFAALQNVSSSSSSSSSSSTPSPTCSLFYRANDPLSIWNPLDDSRFDFSVCFKYSLYSVPFLLLLVLGSIDLYSLSRAPVLPLPSHRTLGRLCKLTYLSKLGLISLVSLLQITYSASLFITLGGWWDPVESLSCLLITFALLYAIPLHHFSHLRSLRSSSSLLFFYLFFLAISLIELRSHLNHSLLHPTLLQPGFLILRSLLVAALFLLECLGPYNHPAHLGPIAASIDQHGHYRSLPQSDPLPSSGALSDPLQQRPECPYVYANIFSRLTFAWMTPLMKLGKSQYLTEEDLWLMPRVDQTDALTNRLHQSWTRQLSRADPSSGPSLNLAIVHAYGWPYLVAALFKFIQDVFQFLQPQLLRRLLKFVDSYAQGHEAEPASRGFTLAALMFGSGLIQTMFLHQYFHRVFATGMRARSGLIGVIYQKSLVLSNEEKAGRATGDIVNLMSTDVSRIQDSCSNGLILVSGLFQITLAFISLYGMLGWSMMGGIAVVFLSIPLNTALARLQTRLQKVQMKNKDSRTRLMNEILNNIRSSVGLSFEVFT